MSGIDASSFKAIDGADHLYQSVGILLTTGIGERVMREWVGNPGVTLLGQRNLNEPSILLWWMVTWMVLDLFEPRLRNLRLLPINAQKSGEFECIIAGDEILNGHLDYQARRLVVSIRNNSVVVSAAA